MISLDYQPKATQLHWIRIYFATPTFDLIIKDEKANLETKISIIGGTMGLFAGFSIISGIELLFFVLKFLMAMVKTARYTTVTKIKS